MTSFSLSHKWTVHNFSSFYGANQCSDCEFVTSRNISKFDNKTISNSFGYNESRKNASNYRFIYSHNLNEPNDPCDVYIELCPFGFDSTSKDYVSIFVNFWSIRKNKFNVEYKVTILDQTNQQIESMDGKGEFKKSARFGWDKFKVQSKLKSIKDLTINCEVKLSSGEISNAQPQRKIGKTHFYFEQKVLKSFVHHWELENFSKYFTNSNNQIDSNDFASSSNDSTQFQLCLLPNKASNILLVDFISKSSEDKPDELAHFRVSLLDSSNPTKKLFSKGAPIEITKSRKFNSSNSWPIISGDDLVKLWAESKITIHCEVWIIQISKNSGFKPREPQKSPDILLPSLSNLAVDSASKSKQNKPATSAKTDSKNTEGLLSRAQISNSVVIVNSEVETNDIGLKSITGVAGINLPIASNSNVRPEKLTTSYDWSISNFIDRYAMGTTFGTSKNISFVNYSQISFYLQFYPKGIDGKQETPVIRLYLDKFDQKELNVKATLSIKDNKMLEAKAIRACLGRAQRFCDWNDFITKKFIQNKQKEFLVGDKLILCCKIEVLN